MHEVLQQLGLEQLKPFNKSRTLNDIFAGIGALSNSTDVEEKIIRGLIKARTLNVLNKAFIDKFDVTAEVEFNVEYAPFLISYFNKIQFRLPVFSLSPKSLLLSILVMLTWGLVVFAFFFSRPDFFIVVFNVFSFVLLMMILIAPGILLAIIAPRYFYHKEFLGVKTVNDFVSEVYRLNGYRYREDNYHLSKTELMELFGPF